MTHAEIQAVLDAVCDEWTKKSAEEWPLSFPVDGQTLGEIARDLTKQIGVPIVVIPIQKRARAKGNSVSVHTICAYALGDPPP